MFLQLVLLYFVSATNCNYIRSEVKLITSYVEKQTSPSQVTLYTCWNKQETHRILQEFSKNKISANVVTTFAKIIETKHLQNLLIIVDSNCADFDIFLVQANDLQLFRSPYKWFVLDLNSKISPSTQLLLDSNFAVATKMSKNLFWIRLFYKYTLYDDNLVFNDLATFSTDNDFQYYNPFAVATNRSNMMGSNLTVSYVLTKPSYPLDVTDYRYNHIDSVSKLSYILVYHLLEMLNCTKNFIQRRSWGYKKDNETYYDGGMFGDIQNGTAEIAGTVAFYTLNRLELIDYVAVTTPSDMKFILKAPPLSYVNNVFTLPFEVNVWYSCFFIIAFTILILYAIVICENKYEHVFKDENHIASIKPKFLEVIMVQVGALTQQGSYTEPKSTSGRIAVFTVFLVLMFLYNAYSAYIVVLLQSTSDNIRTIKDLLDSKISLGVEDIVYSKYYFPIQQEPIRKAIYENKIAPKGQNSNFMKIETGMEKMRDEFFAFHCETTSGYKVVMDTFQEHEKCGLIEVDYLNTLHPSISVKKGSPYKDVVKVGFRKIYESGIRHRQMNRIYYKRPHCSGKGGSFTSVGIIDAYFPITIFCAGVLISAWLLLVEIFLFKYRQHLRFFWKQLN